MNSNPVEVEYNRELWDLGQIRTKEQGILPGNKNGIQGVVTGLLGEVIVEHFLDKHGVPYTKTQGTDALHGHDLWINGEKVEIKSKWRHCYPMPDYDASVMDYTRKFQDVSYYIFVSLWRKSKYPRVDVVDQFKTAHIVGWCTPAELKERGKFWGDGMVDRTNNQVMRNGSMNILIDKLNSVESLLERVGTK